jgi:hypothetical protein
MPSRSPSWTSPTLSSPIVSTARKASLLLYALQTAAPNVKNLDFEFSGDGEHFIEYRTDHYDDHDNLAALDATEPEALPDPKPAACEPSPSAGKRA